MRHLLQAVISALPSADADSVVGAEWGKAAAERITHRSGYRPVTWIDRYTTYRDFKFHPSSGIGSFLAKARTEAAGTTPLGPIC